MRKLFLVIVCVALVGCGGQTTDESATEVNPFFADYGTPFNVQPFDRIDEAHFVPAFEEAMTQQNA